MQPGPLGLPALGIYLGCWRPGGSAPPPANDNALDFSDADNSGYLVLIMEDF